jgi:hypothetical protein
MSHHDAIRDEAGRRLKRQADLTAYAARRFSEAVRHGDLAAARRWSREYQLSAACCGALGRQARGEPRREPRGEPRDERRDERLSGPRPGRREPSRPAPQAA